MARIRTVKPEFWLNEELASISPEACLLAIGLLNICDDEGYFKANEKLISAAIFPLRELPSSITVLIQELSKIGYIKLYVGSDRKSYGLVVNFNAHQVINKPKSSKIKDLLDVPYEYGTDVVEVPDEYWGKGKEGKGMDSAKAQSDKPTKKTTACKPDDVSDEVWDGWIAHRKIKKATISELVIKQHRQEAQSAGISLDQALTFAISKGWVAFNANYYRNAVGSNGNKPSNVDNIFAGAI